MMIMCFAVVIRMLNVVIINGIIRAGGDNAFCLRMDFIAMWMVGIQYVFAARLSLDGISNTSMVWCW